MARKLLAAAARIGGATELDAYLVEVAVGEVLARGSGGRDNGEPASISISVELRGRRFIVSFADDRRAGRKTDVPEERAEDDGLGWGLYVVSQVVDEVEIRPPIKKGQIPVLRLAKGIGWRGASVPSCSRSTGNIGAGSPIEI